MTPRPRVLRRTATAALPRRPGRGVTRSYWPRNRSTDKVALFAVASRHQPRRRRIGPDSLRQPPSCRRRSPATPGSPHQLGAGRPAAFVGPVGRAGRPPPVSTSRPGSGTERRNWRPGSPPPGRRKRSAVASRARVRQASTTARVPVPAKSRPVIMIRLLVLPRPAAGYG